MFNRLAVFYKDKNSNEFQQKLSSLSLLAVNNLETKKSVCLGEFTFDLAPHVGKKSVMIKGKTDIQSGKATDIFFEFTLSVVNSKDAAQIGVDLSLLADGSNELELEYAAAASGLSEK